MDSLPETGKCTQVKLPEIGFEVCARFVGVCNTASPEEECTLFKAVEYTITLPDMQCVTII